ncbi:MAG: cell division protein FtsQ/DivIB [Lachnospiraceae bacterium]|nr:cell division protein FtsQ/DivIB [Lachnospiraceae bacterium]
MISLPKLLLKKKIKKYVFISLVVLLACGMIGIITTGKIEQTSVVGCDFYQEEEIKQIIMNNGITKHALGLYLTNVLGKSPEIPFVDKIEVNMTSWNSVEIIVYEKAMVGSIKYMGEYLYFDKDGVIIESSVDLNENVPLIEGVVFTSMNLYEKMVVEEDAIFEKILGISQLLSKYEIKVDKVVFEYDKSVTLHIGKIKVKMGQKKQYDDEIAELSKLIPKVKKQGLKGILDMRNFKEGQDSIVFKKEE